MTAITHEIEETLRTLEPQRASALERAFREMLSVAKGRQVPAAGSAVDANGWPVGYWEKYAGCLAGDDWEPPPDLPPDPLPE